ncbi:MgtC/SapB family protein [Haloprofundus salilacus]|uniref:MgtC/SapB family protein n=1 Tax=Haloprofundus salilacus TaxID=2876190 RepID=UPI001CC90AFF|nr:MgtC/SapB family protein [Haloprofundus salilacus]
MLSLSVLQSGGPLPPSFDETVARLVLAAALGLFMGLEREWSDKSAGIRTFSLTSLVAAVFTILAREENLGEALLAVGGVLVIVQGVLLAAQSLRDGEDDGLSLTTSVSLLVAYGVGALVASGYVLAGVTVAVVSSLLLVLKRELHGFAGALSREELRSSTEFAILAFVVYPLLPPGEIDVYGIPLEPRVAWLMVVTVAGIGIVNYAVVRSYGSRGIAVTGFFGGLASSTAVVGTMLDHVNQRPEAATYGVAGVLLANAAMAVRNLAIVLVFTLNSSGPVLTAAIVPLGVIVVGSVAIAAVVADWATSVEMDLESPFSLQNALSFGVVFLLILATGTLAQAEFGSTGLFISAFASGLVSSAGATTSAVLLYRSGTISGPDAIIAVLLATASSIVVKAALSAAGPKPFARRVALWSVVVLAVSGVATFVVATLG